MPDFIAPMIIAKFLGIRPARSVDFSLMIKDCFPTLSEVGSRCEGEGSVEMAVGITCEGDR